MATTLGQGEVTTDNTFFYIKLGNVLQRVYIDSLGTIFYAGKTSYTYIQTGGYLGGFSGGSGMIGIHKATGSNAMEFANSSFGTLVGRITINASSTSYVTTSDYRLKENVVPMTGALEKVLQLNPVTYTWKVNGSEGQGFIAHELQAICPDAVTGVKDGTKIEPVVVSEAEEPTFDEDGNELTPFIEATYEERVVPDYQGVDTSFLVATLAAAIQELKAELDAAKARIETLEANQLGQ